MIDHTDQVIPHLIDFRHKSGIKDLQELFFQKYSAAYCDNLGWLKMFWGYVELYFKYIMGDDEIDDMEALMGKTYLVDLVEKYGNFLELPD